MNCPTCSVELKMADRQGVEIDYCPGCRGVWLDRGELDKIIERSANSSEPARDDPEPYHGQEYRERHYGRKKKSFLRDMFDFD